VNTEAIRVRLSPAPNPPTAVRSCLRKVALIEANHRTR